MTREYTLQQCAQNDYSITHKAACTDGRLDQNMGAQTKGIPNIVTHFCGDNKSSSSWYRAANFLDSTAASTKPSAMSMFSMISWRSGTCVFADMRVCAHVFVCVCD